MKHYDLDKISPIMRDCKNFFNDLVLAYRIQGFKIPNRLKKLRSDIDEQITIIEGDSNDK